MQQGLYTLFYPLITSFALLLLYLYSGFGPMRRCKRPAGTPVGPYVTEG